jgi:serine/threonine protein phosphatase PrpC
MAAHCPVCHQFSTDYNACEHCGADLRLAAPSLLPPAECPLPEGPITLSESEREQLADPERYLMIARPEGWSRLHWLDRRGQNEWHVGWEERRTLSFDILPKPDTIDSAEGTWILAPTAALTAMPWHAERSDNPIDDLARLVDFARELADMLGGLHRHHLFWMNFDPAELQRDASGRLTAANLDLRVFPFGKAPYTLGVHPAFAPPEIVYLKLAELGPKTDTFHLAAFSYYWLAGVLPGGLSGEGLEAVDFTLPPLRIYTPHLPEGVAAVIERGMFPEAAHRFDHPPAFVDALADALCRARERRAFAGPIAWEIGKRTTAGRTKAALRKGNEDQVCVLEYSNPDRAFVAVCDGISTCDVGQGALASFITTMVLENALTNDATATNFAERIAQAALKSSQTLLDWAIEKGHKHELLQGRDLMGTTLACGWLEGNRFQIANLGDSRVYLIVGPRIEQLTIDGDLATDLLRQSVPPERVREIGNMGKALRQCIGGCEATEDNQLAVVTEASTPTLGEWRLVPGDIVVVCTDGLVEEGAFLEPEILVEIVRNHPEATAQELAEAFVESADALQRLPSAQEPEGFGDNVSCVVVKIMGKAQG